jgi:hypothetical protein
MADFVSFNEFIDRTGSARLGHHIDMLKAGLQRTAAPRVAAKPKAVAPMAPVKDDVLEAEFQKMKQYVLDLYKDATSSHTFLDPSGNFVDCIPVEQQATIRAARKAGYTAPTTPPPTRLTKPGTPGDAMAFGPESAGVVPTLRRGILDLFGNPLACPEGRVPIRRITLSQLSRFGKLENFFRKAPGRDMSPLAKKRAKGSRVKSSKAPAKKATAKRPSQPQITGGGGETHRHVISHTDGPVYGCSLWLNLWDSDPSPGVFNLSQLWILGRADAGGVQTIESGWQVYPDFYQTNVPVLFVFFNPDNYTPGGRNGYIRNQQNQGFIQVSPNWVIGGALPGPFSTRDGPQYGFQMQWELDNGGNWWLYLGSDADGLEAVGYFPAGLYQGGSLTGAGDYVEFGGEVSSRPPSSSTGPMGSGLPPFDNPADSFREVAFQKLISSQTSLSGSMDAANLTLRDTGDSAFYRGFLGNSDKWGSYLFFGGANAP